MGVFLLLRAGGRAADSGLDRFQPAVRSSPASAIRRRLLMDPMTLPDDANLRFRRIEFAVRNDRWWEARVLLAEADSARDWTALGHASAEVYHARALGLHPVACVPPPGRLVE
jgi:hypothetical protein